MTDPKSDRDLTDKYILVADDEAQVVKLVESVLLRLGLTKVLRAIDGAQAIHLYETHGSQIGLIICDWNMPETTGLDVLLHVRQSDSKVPFLMLTGEASRDMVVRARESGVTAYVRKPFSIGEIEEKVTKLMA